MVRLNTIRKNAEIIKKHADHYAALATSDKDYSEMVDYYSRVLVKDLEKMEEIREEEKFIENFEWKQALRPKSKKALLED